MLYSYTHVNSRRQRVKTLTDDAMRDYFKLSQAVQIIAHDIYRMYMYMYCKSQWNAAVEKLVVTKRRNCH